jgi:hypothetical protein
LTKAPFHVIIKIQKGKEMKQMKFTYKTYMFKRDIEKYKNDIEIIAEEKMDLGSIVTFHCENAKVLDEIFSEE